MRKVNKRLRHGAVAAGCLLVFGAVALPALAATSSRGVSVSPSSGSTGTTFTISFLTPAAAPKGAYRVHGRVAGAATSGCLPTFDFSNPKRVAANQRVKFAFRVTAAQQMCTGRWTVTVKRAGGRSITPSGHFRLN